MELIDITDVLGNVVQVTKEPLKIGDVYVIYVTHRRDTKTPYIVSDISGLYITGTVTKLNQLATWQTISGVDWRGRPMMKYGEDCCYKVQHEPHDIKEKRANVLTEREPSPSMVYDVGDVITAKTCTYEVLCVAPEADHRGDIIHFCKLVRTAIPYKEQITFMTADGRWLGNRAKEAIK